MEIEQVTVEQQMVRHAERQTKALESLLFRADLVLILILIGVVLSLGGALR